MMPSSIACQCGLPAEFIVLASGVTLEVCSAGHRRSLRGRTENDIQREEAAFRASRTETPQKGVAQPCAIADCDGMTSGRTTEFCPLHCEQRRRVLGRERMRAMRGSQSCRRSRYADLTWPKMEVS